MSELLLQRWPPGHELKPHTVIDHGEPAGGERAAPAIDPRDMLAFGGWSMGEPCLDGQFCGGFAEVPLSQRVEKIANEDDALALPASKILFDEMIDPRSIASRTSAPKPLPPSTDSLARSWRSSQVAPGAETCASTPRTDRVASDRRLRPPASS